DYRRWLDDNAYEAISPLGGSFHSENIEDYYFTPYELDYGRIISFDHDFIGREALEHTSGDGARQKVTLAWNGDDVGKAYASMFQDGPGAKFINLPMALYDTFISTGSKSMDRPLDCPHGRDTPPMNGPCSPWLWLIHNLRNPEPKWW